MKCSKAQILINDYVDNLLEPGQVQRLENHMERCANCRNFFLDMNSIVKDAKGLDNLNPSEDLWFVIKRQVLRENRTQEKGLSGNFRLYFRSHAFALSTLLVIMLLAPILYYGLPRTGNKTYGPGKIALKNFRIAEQQYQSAIEVLDKAIDAQATRLSPELMAVFKRNLAIIDESIRICKKAIKESPEVSETNRLLLICYRKKIELLNEVKDMTMHS